MAQWPAFEAPEHTVNLSIYSPKESLLTLVDRTVKSPSQSPSLSTSLSSIMPDRPDAIADGPRQIPRELASRVNIMAHDSCTEQPVRAADVYHFRRIFHDRSGEYAVAGSGGPDPGTRSLEHGSSSVDTACPRRVRCLRIGNSRRGLFCAVCSSSFWSSSRR